MKREVKIILHINKVITKQEKLMNDLQNLKQ